MWGLEEPAELLTGDNIELLSLLTRKEPLSLLFLGET